MTRAVVFRDLSVSARDAVDDLCRGTRRIVIDSNHRIGDGDGDAAAEVNVADSRDDNHDNNDRRDGTGAVFQTPQECYHCVITVLQELLHRCRRRSHPFPFDPLPLRRRLEKVCQHYHDDDYDGDDEDEEDKDSHVPEDDDDDDGDSDDDDAKFEDNDQSLR